MKLSRHAFVTFWDVHAWSGVLVSLVAYVMFVGGTFSVFYGPLRAWEDPPGQVTAPATLDAAAAQVAAAEGLEGGTLDVAFPGAERTPRARIGFFDGDGYRELVVGPDGALGPPPSRLADVLYQMHFLYHEAVPEGFYVAGLIAVAYLLALLTGVLIHLKNLTPQLTRFRPRDRRRVLWSDLHKVLGVWGLPFQLMIALTGAAICLAAIVLPYTAGPAFGEVDRGWSELYGERTQPEPSGRPGPMLAPSRLAAHAEAAVPGLDVHWIRITPYGDERAEAIAYGHLGGSLSPRAVIRLRARDGALLATDTGDAAALQVMQVFSGLHFAGFGGLGLRIVYAILGIAGCLTILSGNWIWLTRRASRRPGRGDRLLSRLTLGVGAGLPIAIAVMFWVNRLTAAGDGRGALEAWSVFGSLAALVVAAQFVTPGRRAWSAALAVSGVGFLAIPLLSLGTRPAHLFNGGGPLGWQIAGVDLGMALLGALLCGLAALLGRPGTDEECR